MLDDLSGTNLNLISLQKWEREAEEWIRKVSCGYLTYCCSFGKWSNGPVRIKGTS